jgi:hypothetical protein
VATVTFTSQSGTVLYTDLPTRNADYIAVQVQTDVPIADAWVQLTDGGGNITNVGTGLHQVKYQPGPNVPGSYAGPVVSSGLAAGVPKTLFFLVKAAALNAVPQNLTFTLYNGDPGGTGVQQGSAGTLPFTVESTILAHANKPNVVVTVPANPQPGQLGQITFTGCTGTVGANKRLYFTPASESNWLPDTFEIIDSDINIANYPNNDYQDQLKIPTADVLTTDNCYTAIYNFIIVGPGTATASPINYIDSGQHLKYVAPAAGSFSVVIPPPGCDQFSAITVSPATLPNATDGSAYSQQLSASGGPAGTYAFTSSALPAWLNLSSSGLLSGTPSTGDVGSFSFTVTATDTPTDGQNPTCTGERTYNFTVDPAPSGLVNVPTLGYPAMALLALALAGAAFLLIRKA